MATQGRARRDKGNHTPSGTPCHACAGAESARKAVGVDPDLKAANLRQLRRIQGQVAGLARMVESERYCADVITQISAVRESLRTVARNLLRNHLTHCAASAMDSDGSAREGMIEEILELAGKIAG